MCRSDDLRKVTRRVLYGQISLPKHCKPRHDLEVNEEVGVSVKMISTLLGSRMEKLTHRDPFVRSGLFPQGICRIDLRHQHQP
jgi:hypothetical protein